VLYDVVISWTDFIFQRKKKIYIPNLVEQIESIYLYVEQVLKCQAEFSRTLLHLGSPRAQTQDWCIGLVH